MMSRPSMASLSFHCNCLATGEGREGAPYSVCMVPPSGFEPLETLVRKDMATDIRIIPIF
jgi:hypothetical protein